MLWLGLHFPRLALDVLAPQPEAVAVIADERIVLADAVAEAAGIRPGMRLATAWAHLPQLTVLERRPDLEAAALNTLACWAGAFTPEVCQMPALSLLLDVGSCLRLFGGADALLQQVFDGCVAQGFGVHAAFAPTPLAASWLAQVSPGTHCFCPTTLRKALAALPVAVLEAPPETSARLNSFGLTHLADLLALPPSALMRRIGTTPVLAMSRALGDLPDPRPRFAFPPRFAQTLELPAQVDHAAALLFAAQRLVAALCGWLAQRSAGITGCMLWLEHERGKDKRASASRVELNFSDATRNPDRMRRVLRERLERYRLPAPVLAMRLEAHAPAALPGRSGQLFTTGAGSAVEPGSIAALVECLQARLGADSVLRPEVVADHRPECATRLRPWSLSPAITDTNTHAKSRSMSNAATQGQVPDHMRPLWLLPEPEALAEQNGRPQRHGPLQLIAGPERIESGWWDAGEAQAVGDVRRDYFIARSPRHECLWIFRTEAGWFLHGVFA